MGKKLSKKLLNWLNIILKINLTAYRTKKLQKAWNYYSLSLIKIDVQGYEEQVLIGAINSIKKVRAIKLECSLVSLYERDKTYEFYFDWLKKLGFVLFDLEAGHSHPLTGRLLQFDALFVRDK